jgi:3-dehydroquinate dehydratase II
MKKIVIINGPNLNLLGVREPEIYGSRGLIGLIEDIKNKYPDIQISHFQSNIEGELIDALHANGFDSDGIVFNPGGYTHTSIALRDAISAIETPVIEVHISNVHARENFRHISLIAGKCKGTISGLGVFGYEAALLSFLQDS